MHRLSGDSTAHHSRGQHLVRIRQLQWSKHHMRLVPLRCKAQTRAVVVKHERRGRRFMGTQFAVGHDKTLQVTCNQHTKMQAPTTAACILQKNYGTTTCSQANAHTHNPALHHRQPVFNADRCSMQPLTSSRSFQWQPHHCQGAHLNSRSKAHEILLAKTTLHVKNTRVHVELGVASLCQCAFVIKLSIL